MGWRRIHGVNESTQPTHPPPHQPKKKKNNNNNKKKNQNQKEFYAPISKKKRGKEKTKGGKKAPPPPPKKKKGILTEFHTWKKTHLIYASLKFVLETEHQGNQDATTLQTGWRYIERNEDVCDLKRCLFTGQLTKQ